LLDERQGQGHLVRARRCWSILQLDRVVGYAERLVLRDVVCRASLAGNGRAVEGPRRPKGEPLQKALARRIDASISNRFHRPWFFDDCGGAMSSADLAVLSVHATIRACR
jgi:hypothetical protein